MILRYLLALSCLAVAHPLIAQNYRHRDVVEESHAFQPDGALVVANVNGKIEILTWDRNEIHISAEKRAASEEELAQIKLLMKVSAIDANVKVELPKRAGSSNNIRALVNLTIQVPATARVQNLETVNGAINVSGIRRGLRASSVNGAIEASDVAGGVDIETVNGKVTVNAATVRPDENWSLETVNGRVELRLPGDTGADVRASVVNGRINCDFPLQDSQVQRRSLRGRIGNGGATVALEAVNGSIHITRR
jgi:hypothetical protein